MIKFVLDYSNGVPIYRQITTQQGSGTFINQVDSILLEKERNKKLKDICTQFSILASTYGFTIEEIKAELSKCEILNKYHHEK